MPFKLLFREIRYRLGNSLAALAAIAAAAGLFVAGPALLASYGEKSRADMEAGQRQVEAALRKHDDDTRKIMLKLGFNVRIVHKETDLSALLSDYAAVDFPEEYVTRLASSPKITKIAHIAGTLIHPVTLDHRKRMLIGYAREAPQPHEAQKKPIVWEIAPGTVILGSEAGRGHLVGEQVEVLGMELRVAKIVERRDSHDDLMVAVALADAQAMLGKVGKVNAILAISCRCKTDDRIGEVAEQVTGLLPELHVTEAGTQAAVRAHQRAAAAKLLSGELTAQARQRQESGALLAMLVGTITPLVILAVALWIAVLAWINVRDRQGEIGLLRAIGKGGGWIAGLFLGKAALLGLAGGAMGAAVGWLGARIAAAHAYSIPPEAFVAPRAIVLWAVLGAPLIAVLAAYLPCLWALSRDPAAALRDA